MATNGLVAGVRGAAHNRAVRDDRERGVAGDTRLPLRANRVTTSSIVGSAGSMKKLKAQAAFPHYVKLRFAPLRRESCRADLRCSNRAASRVGCTRTEQKAAPLRHLGFGLDKRSFEKVRKHKKWLC